MKILVSTHRSFPTLGGLELHVYKYSKWITEKTNHRILNLSFGKNSLLTEVSPTFSIKNIKSLFILDGAFPIPIFNSWKYYKSIKDFNPDIIHTHGRYFISTYIALLYSVLNQIKLIHTEHIEGEIYFENRIISFFVNLIFNNLSKLLFNKASFITAVSETSTEYLERISKKKVYVIENFIDTEEIDKEIGNNRYENPFGDSTKTIFFPYRLVKSKGYKSLKGVIENNPQFNFLIAGEGEGENYVKKLQANYTNVKFLGKLEHKKAIQVMKSSDILLNLSFQEGLSTTILEAMYLNKWIFATNIKSNFELLSNYPKSLLIDINSNNKRFVLKEQIYKRERFIYNLDNTGKKYLDIYELNAQ